MAGWSLTGFSAVTFLSLCCLIYLGKAQDYTPEVTLLLTTRHSFWTRGRMFTYNLHLQNYTQINVSVITPTSVDFDNTTKKMYWTDLSAEIVGVAYTDGRNNQTVTKLNNASYPEGITVDPSANKLFYTDRGNKHIVSVNLNGFATTTIISNDTDAPWGIVADRTNKVLYWVDHGLDIIESSDYDGNGRTILTNDTYAPTGIAVNEKTGRLYWCEYGGKIKFMMTSGSNEAVLMSGGGKSFGRLMDIALWNGFLYATDRTNSLVVVIPESDGEAMFIRGSGFTNINGIQVFSPNSMETGCVDGMHGLGCNKPCGKCKLDTTCEKTSGVCIGGCDIGYRGAMCTDVCEDGSYGDSCFFKCGNCKSGTTCHHVTGDCPSGCESPWTGAHCRDRNVGPELVVFLTQRHTYFTRGRIYKLTLHHMNFTTLTRWNVITPTSIDYDSVGKRVYWTDISTEQVRSVDIHGHHDEIVAQLNNISYPEGIAVDGEAGKIFYTDRGNKEIVSIEIAGYANKTIVSTQLDSPWGITADKKYKQLYWVDHGSDTIMTCDYNGNGRRNVTNSTHAVFAPTGIAINEEAGRLFWCQYNGAVYSIMKDGSDKQTLLSIRLPIRRFMDISLFNKFLYITDRTNGRITVIPETIAEMGGREMNLSSSSFVRLNGIHVMSPTTQETGCNDGLYGVGCTLRCGQCTENTTCEKTVGVCLARCAPGYTGELCTDTCSAGFYGKRCNYTCSPNCKAGTTCNFVTGNCEGGCASGWTGDKCEDIVCSPGSYGSSVCVRCGECRYGAVCNSVTGVCPGGCNDGWQGERCDAKCSQGYYGNNCAKTCGACADGIVCDPIDGSCAACLESWSGSKCDVKGECRQGTYGDRCTSCGHCKTNTHCDSETGICPHGCQANWAPPKCNERATVCSPGYYGAGCYSKCGHCKDNATCDPTTGSCPGGCDRGFKGRWCRAGCDENYYGFNCTKQCGYCKTATVCEPIDGTCPSGCLDQWSGPRCDKEGTTQTQAAGIVRMKLLDLLGMSILLVVFYFM